MAFFGAFLFRVGVISVLSHRGSSGLDSSLGDVRFFVPVRAREYLWVWTKEYRIWSSASLGIQHLMVVCGFTLIFIYTCNRFMECLCFITLFLFTVLHAITQFQSTNQHPFPHQHLYFHNRPEEVQSVSLSHPLSYTPIRYPNLEWLRPFQLWIQSFWRSRVFSL